ncbi:hypothetical protein [Streptomyces sp. CB02488]|uniref:hypothetical protein n=1 Tax=Streptomyces sp. CB02488 TaxID=1703920 RepID=UPI001F5B295A|nr:hypothetical protein [Streptomyces sp. CB02488]
MLQPVDGSLDSIAPLIYLSIETRRAERPGEPVRRGRQQAFDTFEERAFEQRAFEQWAFS